MTAVALTPSAAEANTPWCAVGPENKTFVGQSIANGSYKTYCTNWSGGTVSQTANNNSSCKCPHPSASHLSEKCKFSRASWDTGIAVYNIPIRGYKEDQTYGCQQPGANDVQANNGQWQNKCDINEYKYSKPNRGNPICLKSNPLGYETNLTYYLLPRPVAAIRIQIQSVKGLCFDKTNSSSNGARPHMWGCDGSNQNQQYFARALGKEHDFRIVNSVASSRTKCVDIKDGKTNDGAEIHQWDCEGQASQSWYLRPAGTHQGKKAYLIVNAKSGKCLDGPDNEFGKPYHIWNCDTNNANQRFIINKVM